MMYQRWVTTCYFWLALSLADALIDRRRVVSQFNIIRTSLINDETTPLQVGNGNFTFNVDSTGTQTLLPLNTLSSWAWHNDMPPTNGELPSDYHGVPRETHGREVYYDLPDPNLKEANQWLIANPNRINLGRIGLTYQGALISASQITRPMQVLDLWNGTINSTFQVDGKDVKVVTQGDFEEDAVAFNIESDLIDNGELGVELDFPYPPIHTTAYKYEVFVGTYDFPLNHTTAIVAGSDDDGSANIRHQLQETTYFVNIRWPAKAQWSLIRNVPEGSKSSTAHRYSLKVSSSSQAPSSISFTVHFSHDPSISSLPSAIQKRNRLQWNRYWQEGGFVDFTSSTNVNATELQRRIITSQYHVRVNSATKGQSSQESGLMSNGWYGKLHVEMVLWHNAHWAIWGKQKYLDNIFPELYEILLPPSIARAKAMGWEDARWPKMTDPPHPMYLTQLAYRVSPTRKTLKRWDRILTETTNYLSSYAALNTTTMKYDLGPPAYGVTENTPTNLTRNLAFELAYWRYALDIACAWKRNLGHPIPRKWKHVASNLALPPQIDGSYVPYDGLNSSWQSDAKLTADPRSLIMLRGILPSTPAVDPKTALYTSNLVDTLWSDDKIRGWGRPVLAMNSAHVGNASRAMRHLTAFDYWHFDNAGFAVRGGDGGTPPPFMPGNAGLLLAVGYLVGGCAERGLRCGE